MIVSNNFISGACNPIYKGLAWLNSYIAYPCFNQIYIVNFLEKKVQFSLKIHKIK